MKKILFTISLATLLTPLAWSQDSNLDKKVRFGLRGSLQPTWLSKGDKNNVPNGASFGAGFGLNLEFRFSDVISLQTGIGGDFDGAKYKLRNDPGNYDVSYWVDDDGSTILEPSQSKKNSPTTVRFLKERSIRSTYLTIPVILKLSTKEYNGLKYFGMFGGEIGVRLSAKAKDTYYRTGIYTNDTTFTPNSAGETTESSINVTKELFPARFALNIGAGAEYRISGTTSVFGSINFFRGLTPYMYGESNYLSYKTERSNGKETYKMVKQDLFLNAIKINIGIMF